MHSRKSPPSRKPRLPTGKKNLLSAKTTPPIWTEIDLDDQATSDHDDRVFDPGLGNLEEEIIDEEEPESLAAQSPQEDVEFDDLVEETLDVQMDSGLLSEFVRDKHIEQRTRFDDEDADPSADVSEVEEDYSEDRSLRRRNGRDRAGRRFRLGRRS